MPTCVKITKLDDGTFTVMECEPEDDMAGEPYESVNDAFVAAEGILSGGMDPAQEEEDAFNQTVGGGVNMVDKLTAKSGGKY